MKNIFKPYSLLLHFLSLMLSFFIGILYANLIEVGKEQMLAGGAIVLGYGVMGAFIGFCISIFTAYKSNRKTIIRLNIIATILIIGFWGYFYLKYQKRQQEKIEKENIEQIKKTTATIENKETALLYIGGLKQYQNTIGLGMFSPHINENVVLYFYNYPNLEKSIQEHIPNDSITFKKSEYGGIDISAAPPWLVPEHLKLDYEILYFKVQSVTSDYCEVIVNTITNQTAFVSKDSGIIQFWPEFLLHINSVEFIDSYNSKVYIKPLEHASTISTAFSFMKPLKIRSNWMLVNLLDDNFSVLGQGWIKWRNNDQLLITYSLLS